MSQPEAEPPPGFSGTQSFLIEANRAQSAIDKNTSADQNARWTTKANFQLKVGDRVGVESVMIQSGQSGNNQNIEFTGENVEGKPYTDDTIVFEWGFYLSNSAFKNGLLPLKFQHGWQQELNLAATGGDDIFRILPCNPPTYPPVPNSSAGAGGYSDGIVTKRGVGFEHTQWSSYNIDMYGNNWTRAGMEANYPGVPEPSVPITGRATAWTNTLSPGVFNNPANMDSWCNKLRFLVVTYGYNSYSQTQPNIVLASPPFYPAGMNMPANGIGNHHVVTQPCVSRNLGENSAGQSPILPSVNGNCMTGMNFPIVPGMGICIADSYVTPAGDAPNNRSVLGIVKRIWAQDDPDFGSIFNQAPLDYPDQYRLIIELREDYEPCIAKTAPPFPYAKNADLFPNPVADGAGDFNGTWLSNIIGFSANGGWSANGGPASSVQTSLETGFAPIAEWEEMWDRKSKANMSVGQINPSVKVSRHATAGAVGSYPGAVGKLYSTIEANEVVGIYASKNYGGIRCLGGAALWDYLRCWNNSDYSWSFGANRPTPCDPQDQGPTLQITPSSAEGVTGIKSMNYTDWCDNKPYILTSGEYQGVTCFPNGCGSDGNIHTPLLQPMTCFIVCKATEKFEDVSKLAEKITQSFHQVNSFLDNSIGNQTQDILSKGTQTRLVTNNEVPYFSNGSFPLNTMNKVGIPPQPLVEGFDYECASAYTGIAPIFQGNLTKCIRANLQIPPNWSKQRGDPFFFTPSDNDNICSSGGGDVFNSDCRGTFRWCNLIHGCMGYRDFEAAYCGDRLIKLSHTWSLNCFRASFYEPAIFPPLATANSGKFDWYFDCGRPVILNCQIPRLLVEAPNVFHTNAAQSGGVINDAFHGANIPKYFPIMTNMYYDDGNIELLTKLIKRREYYDTEAIDAVEGEVAQNAPDQAKNWIVEFDLGMADNEAVMYDNAGVAQAAKYPSGHYNHTAPFYLHETIKGSWQGPLNTTTGVGFPGNYPQPENAQGGANPGAMYVTSPITGSDTGSVSWCCPSQNSVGNGFQGSYKSAKRTGVVKCHSRWIPEYDTNTNVPDFTFEEMPGVFPNLPKAGPQTSTGNICKTHNNLGKNDWVYDPQRSRDANVGIYPYKYVCRNGQERVFLGLSTYKAYQPVEGNRDTWELEAFAYGEFFGWSNSHFDARSIIPLNGDKIKSVKEIEYNLTKYPPYDKDARNNMNYIWCGAGNASCTFDTELNRFKLSHLYTETRLSKLNAGTTASAQIGEQEIVFNKEENAAIFYPDLDINEPPFVNNIGLTATTFYNKANQGIQDAQSGCFLRNIWLPGENWKPPPGVNLQNYISPKVEYENDGDINMGGNPMWSNSQVDISGTRYIDGTKRNRDLIIADLTEASEEMWDGCLLSRCGFTYRDLMPYAGKQDNRFSEFTYGSSNLDLQNSGTKPFLQNTQSDTATNISLSTTITDGTPTFEIGFFNNEPVSVNGLNPGTLAASSIPQLVSCPFYIILSSICETQFQAGDIPQNTICVGQKNYSQGDFFYIQANSYKQLIDMDRTLTEISQEIRNPLTGRLARLGPASCIVYRIERDIFVPLATTDVDGDAVGQPKEHTEGVENTHAISNLLDYTPQDIGVEERAGGAVRVSDPLTTGGSRLMTAPLHEVRREPGYASIISHDDAEQRRLFEKARVSVRGLQESYNEQQQQKGAPELDNDLLYNSLMKLAIQKALANLPVIARHNEILNPKIISLSINKVFEELTEDMAKFKNKEGEIEPKKIMEALRTKDVYISRDGRVVTKRSWKANYAGQVKGRYSISPEVENKMAEILKQGGDITNEIRQAITEKQFTYTPAKWDKSEGQQPFTDTQGMYDYSDKISGISLAARRDKDRAHREANPALQDARNRARRGGTPEERKEARAMARRHISDYYGDDWTKKDLDREIASANRAPVRYMQEHSGGGGGGKEEKGGEKSSVKERADKHRKMEEEAAAESVRGKLVKKEPEK